VIIKSTAPVRIDLAGGTLDIFPLYLFHDGGLTINLAINLVARTRLETRSDNKFLIKSVDLGREKLFNNTEELKEDTNLKYLTKTVHFFNPSTGLNVITECTAPKGSGLGGSSSLLISLTGALNELTNKGFSKTELINVSQGIETSILQIPTGRQDYNAAVHGGLNCIWFDLHEERIERLKVSNSFLDELRNSLLLVYTGQSHYSGLTNWDMFKMRVEKNPTSIRALERIKDTCFKMREALLSENLEKVGGVLLEEWNNRVKLSEGVCTQRMSDLINLARKNGCYSWKVCGAGGGGCMVFMVKPKDKEGLVNAFNRSGAQVLDYEIDQQGLKVIKK